MCIYFIFISKLYIKNVFIYLKKVNMNTPKYFLKAVLKQKSLVSINLHL